MTRAVSPHLVRLATLTDIDTLVRLLLEYYAEVREKLAEDKAWRALEALLDDSRLGQVWMIEYDGHPAGFVVMTVSFSMEYGGLRGFIDHFYVTPQYRNRGLGHEALEEVKRASVRRGVRALYVETGPEGGAAMNAYGNVGFTDSGRCLMTLPLSPTVHEPAKPGE